MSTTPSLATSGPRMPRSLWLPLGILGLAAVALLVFELKVHTIPSYGPETDLLGEIFPAARSLRAGKILAENFEYKGPGYPVLLASAGAALGGNDWLAARLLNVLSAAIGAWFVFLVATRFLSAGAGIFVLLGLFASPIWLRAAIEAGTDMPAFAISMAATWLVLAHRGARAWTLAGLVAGFCYLTRYNTVSLLPAAAIVALWSPSRHGPSKDPGVAPAPRGRVLLALYVAGFTAIVGGWAILVRAFGSGAPRNLNYLNIAYEIYGHGMTWDNYWTDAARHFHSLLDVLRFDPLRAAQALSRNVGTRWWSDIRQLIPVWIGVPAIAGMLIVWPRRPGAAHIAAHAVLAYLVLCAVYYTPRYFLYLIPFYLMGAASLLFHPPRLPWAAGGNAGSPPRVPKPASRSRRTAGAGAAAHSGQAARASRPAQSNAMAPWLAWMLGAGLLLASARTAMKAVEELDTAVPYETRDAGALLKKLGPPGARVMARKPQAPYFAGMEYVPMPQVESFEELLRQARDTHSDYLVFTALEASLRGQFLLLADSGVTLPGLTQVTREVYTPTRYFALYRFTHERIDTAAFAQAMLERALLFARRNPRDPAVQTFVAGLLLDNGQPEVALKFLNWSYRLDPRNTQTSSLAALAYFDLGELAQAGAAAERATSVGQASAPIHALVGVAHAAAGRWSDARNSFAAASALEPTDTGPLLQYAIASLATGDAATGKRTLDRCVAIDPALAPFREQTLRSFAGGGSGALAIELVRRVMMSTIHRTAL